jgi:hypothetical protein
MSKKHNPVVLSTPEARARAERLMLEDIWQGGYQFARDHSAYGDEESLEAAKAAAMKLEVDGFLELRPLILKDELSRPLDKPQR